MTFPMRRLGALAEVALGRQRSPEHERGPHMVPYLRAANVKDGYLDLSDVKEMNFSSREQAIFQLRPGDVLVTEGAGSLAAVGAAAVWSAELKGVVCFQNTLLRLRPRREVDGRYLAWWARHAYADRQFAAEATGVNIYHLSAERVRGISAPHPTLKQQRAIADFLDTETARIDGLIAARTRLSVLLEERRSALLSAAVTVGLDRGETTATGHQFAPLVAAGWPVRRLRHVLSEIVDTEHKTAPAVDDGDFLVVRTANVRRGQLVLDNAQYTDLETWREWTARGAPKPGDVIFTREAPAGEACVVPPSPPLCLGQRTVLLRPRADMILGPWLVHSIYAGAARHFIDVLSRSTTVAHINMSDIPDIPVVVPSVTEQAQTLAALDRALEPVTRLSAACAAQTSLLQERKQALITAAVTGQLDLAREIAEEAS